MQGFFMTCASCGAKLGKFKYLPKRADWRLCEVEPIPPVLKLIAGSSQICTHCGNYMLLPGGKVMTDRGPLEEVLRKEAKPDAVQKNERASSPVRKRTGGRKEDRDERDQFHAGERGDGGASIRGGMEPDQAKIHEKRGEVGLEDQGE